MRFERSSVSIPMHNSRSSPTVKEKVGKFQLAESSPASDNSAMRQVDQIRHRIRAAMKAAGVKPIPLAEELGWERNHLRDYLEGKKHSLKTEKMLQLSERLGIPFKHLIVGGPKSETA